MTLALKSKSSLLSMLGQRIKDERLSQNLSQQELSQRSGVAYSTLRKIESSGEGSMKDYINILQAMSKVDQLDHFLPASRVNPEVVYKAGGKIRQRATGTR